MAHYHLASVVNRDTVVANATIDTWPDALEKYVGITNLLFGHLLPGQTGVELAAKSMEHGAGKGSFAGTQLLSVALLTCEDECEWASPTWN